MKATVKVQTSGNNVYINLPKELREQLDIKKGDILLLTLKDGKIVIEK